jgi:hypothetical protein
MEQATPFYFETIHVNGFLQAYWRGQAYWV